MRAQLKKPTIAVVGLWILLAATGFALDSRDSSKPIDTGGYVGNEACAKCHASEFDSYKHTAMARASGPAADNLIAGTFSDKKSAVNYRIYTENGKVWLTFGRPGDSSVGGKRELLYYIGEGRRGRTYLFSVDGFVFESPVNWYTDRHLWDMAPGYSDAREIPLNLPALPSCLDCHVSGIQPPIEGTENRYKTPVFAYSGVTCERCHGPGTEHVKGGAIVNPAKLAPERRDAVCMQCHLEGNVAIERPGKRLYEFRPGDKLSDYVRYYVKVDENSPGLRAASQFEALALSACKRKSGDAMSCTSCHDPHQSPTPEQRVGFYRAKCLACHTPLATKHHPDKPDCTACHMPALSSMDIAHTEVTDHRIQRRPAIGPSLENAQTAPASFVLQPFPNSPEARADARDFALAWASAAQSGNPETIKKAERLLREALAESPKDAGVLASLAYLEQKRGAVSEARELYQRALAQDSTLLDAATNLGVIEATSGHMNDAVGLWESAFRRAPGRSSIGMNLAYAFCGAGQFQRARDFTLRVLQFNPDHNAAKKLLNGLNAAPPNCSR